jgi:RHS repeat-associated protein
MTDGSGTTTWNYNNLGQLSSDMNGNSQTTSYIHDGAGNVTQITYPNSPTGATHGYLTQGFDSMNRLASVKDWFAKTTTFGYDMADQLKLITYPNGTTSADTYNNGEQLTQIVDKRGTTVLGTAGYTPNKDGISSSATDLISGATLSYTYDQFNRLRTEAQSGTTTTYTPDNAGDITGTSVSGGGPTATLTYDTSGTGELITDKTVTGATTNSNWTFGYNLEGDQTTASDSVSGTSYSYVFDQANRLTSWVNGTYSNAFGYDGNGQMVSQVGVTPTTTTTSHFNWDYSGDTPAMDEITQVITGVTTHEFFVNGPGLTGGSATYEQIGPTGTVSYYYADKLGSMRVLLDSSGNPQNTYSYSDFGQQTNTFGSATTPLQYAGQYNTSAGSPMLQYMGARWYNPVTMSFISRDPLQAQTNQPYLYVGDDPVNWTDPTGLCPPWVLYCPPNPIELLGNGINDGLSWTNSNIIQPAGDLAGQFGSYLGGGSGLHCLAAIGIGGCYEGQGDTSGGSRQGSGGSTECFASFAFGTAAIGGPDGPLSGATRVSGEFPLSATPGAVLYRANSAGRVTNYEVLRTGWASAQARGLGGARARGS